MITWELFFSAVRQRGGWNNNPSAVQFSNAFRSLLSHAGVSITGSAKANCVPQDTTSLLNVVDTEPDDDIVSFINFESALSDHPYSCTKIGLSVFVEGIIVYIAGWVVRSVTKQVSCKECSLALISPASECRSALLKLKNNCGLVVHHLVLFKLLGIVKLCCALA